MKKPPIQRVLGALSLGVKRPGREVHHSPVSSAKGVLDQYKIKLSLCFNSAPRHEGVLGEWRYSSTHSLTSALDGGEWSVSRPGRFIPRERASGVH
jgi:hypothetical protein